LVPSIKHCERCFKAISWEDSSDWYSHISIRYCDDCKKIVEKEKAAERFRRFQERKKEAEKVRDARLKELEIENAILREKIKELWDKTHSNRKGES